MVVGGGEVVQKESKAALKAKKKATAAKDGDTGGPIHVSKPIHW